MLGHLLIGDAGGGVQRPLRAHQGGAAEQSHELHRPCAESSTLVIRSPVSSGAGESAVVEPQAARPGELDDGGGTGSRVMHSTLRQ